MPSRPASAPGPSPLPRSSTARSWRSTARRCAAPLTAAERRRTVSAPVAGKVLRTPYHVGDPVIADETVVATMEPARPSFHDVRTHEELQNIVAAADAAVRFAEADVRRMEAALDFARSELRRAQALARTE